MSEIFALFKYLLNSSYINVKKNKNLNDSNSFELLKFIVLKFSKVNNPNINAFNFSSHLSKNFFISGLLSNFF